VVYAKSPFGGSEPVPAHFGRYTHRVAIANSRLLSLANGKIRFTWNDYRAEGRTKVMTLDADEFIRRLLLHALPDGFHRFRHYGFLANGYCASYRFAASHLDYLHQVAVTGAHLVFRSLSEGGDNPNSQQQKATTCRS